MMDHSTGLGSRLRGHAGRAALAAVLTSTVSLVLPAEAWAQEEAPSPKPEAAEEPARKLTPLGGRCGATAECDEGLRCVERLCVNPRLGTKGESCVRTSDCNPPLGCIDQRCWTRGARPPSSKKADPDAPYVPDAQNMSKEEGDLYAEMLAVKSSGMQGMSGTLGFGYGGGGFAYSAFLSQRMSSLLGFSGYLGAVSGFDGGAIGAVGAHIGHVLFIDPMIGYIRPGNYSTTRCDYTTGMGTGNCYETEVAPNASLGVAIAAGLEIPLSRSWALTPMLTAASTFEDDFFDKRNRVILFSIGPTAMMGREEDFHDELKAMRKKRSE